MGLMVGGDHREFVAAIPVADDGCFAPRRPGAPDRGKELEAGFVDEHQVGSQPGGVFIIRGPAVPLPSSDGLVVSFQGPAFRFLDAPAQAVEDSAHVVVMVGDPEALSDQVGYPAGGPQVGGVAVCPGPLAGSDITSLCLEKG